MKKRSNHIVACACSLLCVCLSACVEPSLILTKSKDNEAGDLVNDSLVSQIDFLEILKVTIKISSEGRGPRVSQVTNNYFEPAGN